MQCKMNTTHTFITVLALFSLADLLLDNMLRKLPLSTDVSATIYKPNLAMYMTMQQ